MPLDLYKKERPNSIHVIQDATQINYKDLFESNNAPTNIDFLQIDLEKLDEEVMDTYKFATVTFQHDIYHTNSFDTRRYK